MAERISVLLVDDQRLMRDGLRTLLELEPDIDVVGEAENGQEAQAVYEAVNPDVVLMDIRMPILNGVDAIQALRQRWPGCRVIILTTFDDDAYVFEGLRAGAMGYLLKDVYGEELAAAIRTVAGGGALIDPSVTRKVVAEFARLAPGSTPATATPVIPLLDPLSERELDVLRLITQGFSNREIAAQLHLAEGTVKNYVSNILSKIDARDRTQAALRARELGLV